MIFTVKKVKNTNIVCIHTKKFSEAECLQVYRFISRQVRLKNRYIMLKLNQNLILNNFFVEMLLSIRRICDKNNAEISLCDITPDNLCILYLLKLDKFFEFYENEYDAFMRENRFVKRYLRAV